MGLFKLATGCLALLALLYPVVAQDDIFTDTYVETGGKQVVFGGTFVDRPVPTKYTVTLTHDQGFITTYTWENSEERSDIIIGFGSVTEVNGRNVDRKTASKIFNSGYWNNTIVKYKRDVSTYMVNTGITLKNCNVNFASNFTDSTVVTAENPLPPGYFKYSVTVSNFNYVYSQSILQLDFFVATKLKRTYDEENNAISFGNNNETVFHWVPYVVADNSNVPIVPTFIPNVGCAAVGLMNCTGNDMTFDILRYEIQTNAKVIYWDPDVSPHSKAIQWAPDKLSGSLTSNTQK
jgi:hypothetical protein